MSVRLHLFGNTLHVLFLNLTNFTFSNLKQDADLLTEIEHIKRPLSQEAACFDDALG